MPSFFLMKAVRLLLAISVSVWMAGGCLFGCSSSAMGAEAEDGNAVETVVAAESCHAAAQSHDCCSHKQKPKKRVAAAAKQPKWLTSFTPAPGGMMKDCPLVVNATAATSKNSSHLPHPGRVPGSSLPLVENTIEHSNTSLVVSYLPNRGPTHLRCCVFLI
jgi:hypothetical protein